MASLLQRNTFVVITGASRGLGKSIASIFATKVQPSSTFLLLARNTSDLEAVKASIVSEVPQLTVIVKFMDQAKLDTNFKQIISDSMTEAACTTQDFGQAMIVHNSGVLGDLSKYAWEMTDVDMVESSTNCNISGMVLLNAAFLQAFPARDGLTRTVINISSLAGILPMASHSLYCMGKAARDMFFRVLAKEDPSLRVLNYAPGPLDTDMLKSTTTCRDPELRKAFNDLVSEGKVLKCETTVNTLLYLLEKNTFESGDHIDVYDVKMD